MEGSIIKGVGGFYYVSTDSGVITCKAKGAFRREGVTPVVGDRVSITPHETGYAQIDEILPRRNLLVRPPVANLDRLLIVLSAHLPEPDWLLADKLIVQARLNDIEPVMVLNKADEAEQEIREAFERDYRLFPRIVVSALSGEGLQELKDTIAGKVCCFAGQSAVGKSSLMNALLPDLDLPVGELTRKTDRGKHTTRHAQLWPCFGGALLDTPGFSLYEPESFDEQLLPAPGLLPGIQAGRSLPVPRVHAHHGARLRREGAAAGRTALPGPLCTICGDRQRFYLQEETPV